MKKRADIVSLTIVELIGGFLVAYMAVQSGISYSKDTIHEKMNIAEDLAMQMNALMAMNGNAYIINGNLHGYSIHFVYNQIEVYDTTMDTLKGSYYYPTRENWNMDARLDKPKQIVLSKINGEIRVSEEVPEQLK